jgi:CubicO group peptidase (beta-lactamase class C family)
MVDGKLVKAHPVTVRHILTHTSGLTLNPNERVVGETPENPELPAAGAQQAQTTAPRPKTLAEAIERAAPIPLLFQPGDRWQYGSSTDFVAIIVEKISGMTIDEFLRKRIFEPLGMNDTYYNIPQEKVSRVAAIYRFPNGAGGLPDPLRPLELVRKPQYQEPTTYFLGVAGLNGTAVDYWRFSQMLLNGGDLDGVRLLGRATVDMMFTNHIGTGKSVYIRGDGFGFGLGGAVLTDPAKSADALSVGSWTWGGANGTIFWIDPVEDMIPIMMIQNPTHAVLNIRPLFSVVAEQTIVDSLANQKLRVMGYDTPR